ncbi:hypothetical protein GCM10028808_10310 [Spirosoma migulaei]
MVQVAEYEEFKAIVRRVEALEEENGFLKSLLLGERWLNRKQAMAALGCKDNKLRKLTLTNALTHRYDGKNPYYDAFSIRDYLLDQKIDSKEVEKRIISARFAG